MAIDGLILFHAIEDRSCSILPLLSSHKKLPYDVFVLSSSETDAVEISNLRVEYGINIIIYSVTFDLFENFLPCLIEINKYVTGKNVVGIDISCMPIPIFNQIFHFLYRHSNEKQLVTYYTEPVHYNLENLFDFAAYDGEIDIKSIPGFEGKTSQISGDRRIVFYIMGFEMKYLSRIIPQETNPDSIIPINGFPAYFPKYKDISLINNDTNFHEQGVEIIFAEANNPFGTYNQLIQLKNKYGSHCIDIIPAGTKPMALGACLFALKNGNNDIRILFPFPSNYKERQSFGNGKTWEYMI
jgi:hypothetical protein